MSMLAALLAASAAGSPPGEPEPPGPAYALPERPTAEGAPLVASFTDDAGPDESFLLVGERLTRDVVAWGAHPDAACGREVKPKVQMLDPKNGLLVATLPERSFDGPFAVWVKNDAGFSAPVVLNAPQAWWCSPDEPLAGERVRIFGRNLARRPHFAKAFVWLAGPSPCWLEVAKAGKYELEVVLPESLKAGDYELWVHAGRGGEIGWGRPLKLTIGERPRVSLWGKPRTRSVRDGNVQKAIDDLAARGGGIVRVPKGTFQIHGTLAVPAHVMVQGAGRGKTILQTTSDPAASFARIHGSGWNQGPGRIHTPGDTMTYHVEFPRAATWHVWLRYATEMSQWGQEGVSNNMELSVHGGKPVPLGNLPNTGSFGTFKWSKSVAMHIPAGMHEVIWRNVKGGGINLDAFVFALDPEYVPTDTPLPKPGEGRIVLQGEDVVRFETKEGMLPGADRAAVWLAGEGAAIRDLTICGSSRANLGIVVRSPEHPAWVGGCRVERVTVRDVEGKQLENCGIRLYNAHHAVVRESELWGRAPIFLSGVRQCRFEGNRLVSVTLWGGNSEAYILGRNDIIHECIVEGNVCANPPGAEAGGPTGRRLIWLSTGHGSVDNNWLAHNREDCARFGGVAGTDQNVGEMILFEANERFAYYGPLADAGPDSVTLPATVPRTPDERLGSVKREMLAHDAEGNETPFWPPDEDDGSNEPPLAEYFVTVLWGRGLGQTRRVAAREGTALRLDRPWRVAPEAGSRVVVHTAFYRNHIVGNRCLDGMTGIQLWITCIENIVSANEIARQRKPAFYLYGNCTTLASSMPRHWNRGIGPLYFNHVEGTRCEETSAGCLVISGEMGQLPVEFPRALGNVVRHNSFIRNRTDGVMLTGNRPTDDPGPTSAILGTLVEFNVVRDALVGYHVAQSAEVTLFRRNHAYFWYPVSHHATAPPVAFRIDNERAQAAIKLNSIEGIHGGADKSIIELQRGPAPKPQGK